MPYSDPKSALASLSGRPALQNLTHTISSKSGGLFQQMVVMLYDKFEMPQWSILALSV
jgi:hypothetical protein